MKQKAKKRTTVVVHDDRIKCGGCGRALPARIPGAKRLSSMITCGKCETLHSRTTRRSYTAHVGA